MIYYGGTERSHSMWLIEASCYRRTFIFMNNYQFDKPFKTYDEMIELLQSRNMVITNSELTKHWLSDSSYYAVINGYKNYFHLNGNNFTNPVLIEEIYSLAVLDSLLSRTLLQAILTVELSLKPKVSYIVSKKYGVYTDYNNISGLDDPNDYFCAKNYRNAHDTKNTLLNLKKSLKNTILNRKNLSVTHYVDNHNHLPLWIAVNSFCLGQMIKFYQILKFSDKDYVANSLVFSPQLTIDEKKDFLISSLKILKEYRNKIAHGNQVFHSSVKGKLPKRFVLDLTNKKIAISDYNKGIGNNDRVSVILILLVLQRDFHRKLFCSTILSTLNLMKYVHIQGKSIMNMLGIPEQIIDIINDYSIQDK